MFDLGIINGKIYLEGSWFEGNIYIKDKKIAAISRCFLETKEEYNADGNYVLPGFVDPHVHFALTVGKHTSADDFYNGSVSAAFGGITTFIDFIDPVSKSDELDNAISNRMKKAEKSIIDYSFHATIANLKDNSLKFIEKMKSLGIPTIKLFTTYSTSNRRTTDRTIDNLLNLSKEKEILVLVHAENDGIVLEGQKLPVSAHEDLRPAIAEISEILKLAEMTRYRDGRMYIVHNSCGTTVESLKKGYSTILNKDFIIESCPHYFILSKDQYYKEDGYLYTMTPALRSSDEVERLIVNIDNVFVIGTDHCPFYKVEKNKEFLCDIPMGVGGIEYSFSIMYSLFGNKIIDKYTKNPAVIHGLYPKKGSLYPGADADIAIFNPKYEYIVSGHHSNADYSIYEGIKIKGKICSTISKGKFVVKEGVLIGGKGEFVRREVKVL
ncbi:dihydropyrimidinase [Clostridium polyendosporum]|uniref:Dihydropyrimidinase n=1 Tax=Clostridium polyendosporum TaxID=69208 RepID=A0A919S162_9CLOT|nr:amidohydrolase family protein [Clostridium polyendosporum]GIM29260.1 dihydropyrimidinase [Clostridium polyendosporum]